MFRKDPVVQNQKRLGKKGAGRAVLKRLLFLLVEMPIKRSTGLPAPLYL